MLKENKSMRRTSGGVCVRSPRADERARRRCETSECSTSGIRSGKYNHVQGNIRRFYLHITYSCAAPSIYFSLVIRHSPCFFSTAPFSPPPLFNSSFCFSFVPGDAILSSEPGSVPTAFHEPNLHLRILVVTIVPNSSLLSSPLP